MKKYLYIVVLLGTIILAGCMTHEETTEGLAVGKAAEAGIPVTSLELTQQQKEEYYNQYLQILADLRLEYPSAEMKLTPLDEFLDENWVEPMELREKLVDFLKYGAIVYKK